MSLCLSAPSKTFLTGEYAVLGGGPALILNTEPRFELRVRSGTGRVSGFPAGSPAALWVEQRRPLLSNFDIEFFDPHFAQGGFGASGAQFLLIHTFTTFLQTGFSGVVGGINLADLWNDHNVLSKGKGSGADVLAQSVGGVARVLAALRVAEPLTWPYDDMGFCIVRTQEKVATHTHVAELERAKLSRLVNPAVACAEAFARRPSSEFARTLRDFAQWLSDLHLQADVTRAMCETLARQTWCLAAKGCGALGADTVLFLYPRAEAAQVHEFLLTQRWPLVADEALLTAGLRLEWRPDHAR